MMYVRYLIAMCEKVSDNLWILYCGIMRFVKCLMVGMCMEPCMYAVIMRGGRTFYPCSISRGHSMA